MDNFTPFTNFIMQKVMPTIYDESLSYYETLEKLINYTNEMITSVNTVITNNNGLNNNYGGVIQQLNDLKTDIEKMKTGFYIKDGSISSSKMDINFYNQLKQYVADTVHEIVQFVWFGLNDDGHFIAIIPSSWSQIIFSTNSNGELTLTF